MTIELGATERRKLAPPTPAATSLPLPAPSRPEHVQAQPQRQTAENKAPRSRRLPVIAGGGGAFVLLIAAILLVVVLPRWAGGALRDSAEKSGVALTYDSIAFTFGGAELTNLQLAISTMPGTKLAAKHGRLSYGGGELALTGVEATSDASIDDLAHALSSIQPAMPAKLRLDDVHVIYTFARDLTIDGAGATITADAQKDGTRPIDVVMPSVMLSTSAGSFGPFTVNARRDRDQSKVTVSPPQGTHDGASVEVTWVQETMHVVAHAPRGVYAVPAKALGLAQDDSLEMEANLDATFGPAGELSGTGSIAAFKIWPTGVPIDLSWEFSLSGDSLKVTAKNVRARLGPFQGEVNGTWSTLDHKKVTLSFHTSPVTCAELARHRAHQGNVPALLLDLGEYAGLVKETGQASAAGAVTVVLETPPRLQSSITANDTCGLTIFPR